MSKFKVGDKVRLVNDEHAALYGFEIGDVCEITNIDESAVCYIEIINNNEVCGYVNDYNIELVEDKKLIGIRINNVAKSTRIGYFNDLHSMDAFNYVMGDMIKTKELIKNKEEKDMNKVLELYAKRKREEIDKKYKEKVEKDYNDLELVKKYKETIREFEENMDMIYNSELNAGESTIHQCYTSSDYKYVLNCDIKNNIEDIYSEEHNKEIKAINDLVEEVEAQLSLSNDLEYQRETLEAYGIIDKKSGKIK